MGYLHCGILFCSVGYTTEKLRQCGIIILFILRAFYSLYRNLFNQILFLFSLTNPTWLQKIKGLYMNKYLLRVVSLYQTYFSNFLIWANSKEKSLISTIIQWFYISVLMRKKNQCQESRQTVPLNSWLS